MINERMNMLDYCSKKICSIVKNGFDYELKNFKGESVWKKSENKDITQSIRKKRQPI